MSRYANKVVEADGFFYKECVDLWWGRRLHCTSFSDGHQSSVIAGPRTKPCSFSFKHRLPLDGRPRIAPQDTGGRGITTATTFDWRRLSRPSDLIQPELRRGAEEAWGDVLLSHLFLENSQWKVFQSHCEGVWTSVCSFYLTYNEVVVVTHKAKELIEGVISVRALACCWGLVREEFVCKPIRENTEWNWLAC